MAQRRCYGCMGLTDGPVCGSCGTREDEANLPHQLPRGTVLAGRFLVGRALEEYPGGIDYLALDQSRGEPVRLTMYAPGKDISGKAAVEGVRRFQRISQALAGETRLAEVSGTEMTFEDQGKPCRVSEWIRGGTLKKYVQMRGGKLAPGEALRILEPVLEALAAFHRAGFSHGGLDGEAIVLDTRGGPRLPRIGQDPGTQPKEDVQALCRVLLECMGPEPELTEDQTRALRQGLRGELPTAGALLDALREPEEPAPAEEKPMPEPERKPMPEPEKKPKPKKEPKPEKKPKPEKTPRRERGGLGRKLGVLLLAAAVLAILAGLAVLLVRNVHVWKAADCETPAVCRLCGLTRGKPLGHDWLLADCEKPQSCARCGELQGGILGHDWKRATCTEPKTCARCGLTEGEALGHDWAEATCTEPKTCLRCGLTEGEPLGHDWLAATYFDPETCARCGEISDTTKGYLAVAQGSWEYLPWEGGGTRCLRLEEPIQRAAKLTLHFMPRLNSNIQITRWKLLCQRTDGTWVEKGSFRFEGTPVTKNFYFVPSADIAAIAVVPASGGCYTYSFTMRITDIRYECLSDN